MRKANLHLFWDLERPREPMVVCARLTCADFKQTKWESKSWRSPALKVVIATEKPGKRGGEKQRSHGSKLNPLFRLSHKLFKFDSLIPQIRFHPKPASLKSLKSAENERNVSSSANKIMNLNARLIIESWGWLFPHRFSFRKHSRTIFYRNDERFKLVVIMNAKIDSAQTTYVTDKRSMWKKYFQSRLIETILRYPNLQNRSFNANVAKFPRSTRRDLLLR